MIVDTSALMAVSLKEPGYDRLLDALLDEPSLLPAPALVEFRRVIWKRGFDVRRDGEALLQELFAGPLRVEGFGDEDARIAGDANPRYGKGNRRGGALNLLDLMVYAVAKRTGLPILCTGRDFSGTDADLHSASRSE